MSWTRDVALLLRYETRLRDKEDNPYLLKRMKWRLWFLWFRLSGRHRKARQRIRELVGGPGIRNRPMSDPPDALLYSETDFRRD